MNFANTDEQRLLGENLRRFLQQENEFEHRRQRLNAEPPQRMALWPGLSEMGLMGAAFDEASGGFGGDARSIGVAMVELGRALAVEPFLASAVIAGRVLTHLADATLREALIGQLIAGEFIPVLAHSSGFDPFAASQSTAKKDAQGYFLNGHIRSLRNGDVATEFLVSAALDGAAAIFRVPAASVSPQAHRLMDGAGAADLELSNLQLPADALLAFDAPAETVLCDALEWGLFGIAAEAFGIISAANQATFEYLGARKQFGVTLATFQALQHRAADMKVAEEELGAILNLAIAALESAAGEQRSALLSALKLVADVSGKKVGHEAIQLHGGMGVSDELNICHFGRRLATMRAELGSADYHRTRFGTGQELTGLLALQDSAEASAWRKTVREFTLANLPKPIARKGELGLKIEKADYVGWQKVLHQHGMFGCAWPREFGGQDWDLVKQLLFVQESSVCNAPMLSPYGVKMVGPVVYTYGTEAQKTQHLPPILSSDIWWCQGYSEPGAGSDLAGIKTTAERDGDHYIVNGAKLWTTEAHWADWMHCLVRTDKSGKPQTGISFLLIDMKTPGISIKPIVTIDGLHHTNALFLDNVRVPVANRVGEEGQGWGIAKFLLANERVSIADTGPKLRLLRHVQALFEGVAANAQIPVALKTLLAVRLADVSVQLVTLCALERQYVEAWAAGARFGAEASILKIRGTEILQAISELALDLEGPLATAYDPEHLHAPPEGELSALQEISVMGYEYLYGRCWSIFGGTNEVQRNILAKQILA
jgi:alkylation response protein AidB-like acyl-CoA dehydrogenase